MFPINNMTIVAVILAFYTVISNVALSLGLATTSIPYPDGLTDLGDINLFEMLLTLPIWALNSFVAILQLAFFTTELPSIISAVVFIPPLYALIYLGIVVARGGAG